MIVKSLSTTNRSLLFLFGLVLLLLSTAANAAAITSAASGNGLLEQLGVGSSYNCNNVIISTGHIVTITASVLLILI
jgi:hypothetical protein